jgi:sugar O-acyltransferase (sialic acid O-acetyltransferase NeuD family)
MKTLAIIGAGDLGQLIAYHAITDKHYDNVVFFDDFQIVNTVIDGLKVIGGIKDIKSKYEAKLFDELIIAIGYKHLEFKKQLFEQIELFSIPFGKILHTSSYIDKSCEIGKGVVVLPGCCLDRNVVIEDNVLINTSCTIAHDSKIGNHCFLSPRVAIAGFTIIDELCLLGINTTIIDNLHICSCVQTGGGALVIKSISDSGLYVGVPVIKIKNIL